MTRRRERGRQARAREPAPHTRVRDKQAEPPPAEDYNSVDSDSPKKPARVARRAPALVTDEAHTRAQRAWARCMSASLARGPRPAAETAAYKPESDEQPERVAAAAGERGKVNWVWSIQPELWAGPYGSFVTAHRRKDF